MVSINKTTKHCVWVLASGAQCGIRVGYNMVEDEDGTKVRSYKIWCAEHAVKAAAQDDEDD